MDEDIKKPLSYSPPSAELIESIKILADDLQAIACRASALTAESMNYQIDRRFVLLGDVVGHLVRDVEMLRQIPKFTSADD